MSTGRVTSIHASHKRQYPGSFASVRHSRGQTRHAHNASRHKQRRGFLKHFLTTMICLQCALGFVLNHPKSRRYKERNIDALLCEEKRVIFIQIRLVGGKQSYESFFYAFIQQRGHSVIHWIQSLTGRKMSRCGQNLAAGTLYSIRILTEPFANKQ